MSLAPGPLHLLILFVANAQFQSRLFFLIYLFVAPLSLPCSVWTSFRWRQAEATLRCDVWALGVKSFSSYGLQAQSLWCVGLVAPQHVESSRSGDRTHVPCLGRRILIHCTTKGSSFKATFSRDLRAAAGASSLWSQVPGGFPQGCGVFLRAGPTSVLLLATCNRLFFSFFWPHCTASGILVAPPGIKPMPLATGAWTLNHWTAREFL